MDPKEWAKLKVSWSWRDYPGSIPWFGRNRKKKKKKEGAKFGQESLVTDGAKWAVVDEVCQ